MWHWEIQLFRPTNKSETSFWVGYTLINIKCSHWCTTHLHYSNDSTMMNFIKTHINTGSEEIIMLRSIPTDCQSQVWSIGQGACLIDATWGSWPLGGLSQLSKHISAEVFQKTVNQDSTAKRGTINVIVECFRRLLC